MSVYEALLCEHGDANANELMLDLRKSLYGHIMLANCEASCCTPLYRGLLSELQKRHVFRLEAIRQRHRRF